MPAAPLGSEPPVLLFDAPSRDTIAVDGGTVRKKSAGLLSLVVAAGLGTTLGVPAVSATPAPTVKNVGTSADKPDDASGHELPNPLEDKRLVLRQEAITEILNGTGKVEKRGASTVMKVSS